jgi:SAM-dependent methyltransferase
MSEAVRTFRAGGVDYNGAMAEHYPASRGLSAETAAAWRGAVQQYIPPPGLTILDLGSGTGRFSGLLATWGGARVVGVEPARGMRAAALRGERHPSVDYVGGAAERLPLSDGSCDVAWLSNVIHHVVDRRTCARELRRVLRGSAYVLIAGAFAGRLDDITLFRYFPGAKQVAEQFPRLEETIETFAAEGFDLVAVQRVTQQTCNGLREMAARTRLRADTTLTLLADDAFARGQAALERAAAAEPEPRPVVDTLDLLVLRRRDQPVAVAK